MYFIGKPSVLISLHTIETHSQYLDWVTAFKATLAPIAPLLIKWRWDSQWDDRPTTQQPRCEINQSLFSLSHSIIVINHQMIRLLNQPHFMFNGITPEEKKNVDI